MARGDDAHIRPDHHIIGDVEAAKVIERAVLIDEDIAPDADFVAAGGIEWRNQQKAFVDLLADELAEQRPDFVGIVVRQSVEAAVIAIARLTFANMAADSGVLLRMILVRSSFGIGYWLGSRKAGETACPTRNIIVCYIYSYR